MYQTGRLRKSLAVRKWWVMTLLLNLFVLIAVTL